MTRSTTVLCDELITQAKAKTLAGGISDMTLWRWRKAGIIPAPLSIRGRNYWPRQGFLEALAHTAKPATD
jgi:hypothetical protein